MDSLIPYLPLIAFLVFGVAMAGTGVDRRSKAIDRRVQRLERKVDLLLEHLGVEDPADPVGTAAFKEIDELLAQDKKIHAIKVYRELTGAGLVEAKEAVERRMR